MLDARANGMYFLYFRAHLTRGTRRSNGSILQPLLVKPLVAARSLRAHRHYEIMITNPPLYLLLVRYLFHRLINK